MKNYTDPSTVTSPQWAEIKIEEVILDTGSHGFSVAKLWYEGELSIGIRWNGTDKHIGMPSARGNPIWFIMPNEFFEDVESKARSLVTDNVDKIAGFIRESVNKNKASTSNSNDYMASVTTKISLSETEKNELKIILEKEKIYFPSPETCGGNPTIDGEYSYNVFYIK